MDREHATALDTMPTAGADLIDFAEVRLRPRKPRPEPTPDELLEAFASAVRRTMLADLATWPEAFQRRLRPGIEAIPDVVTDPRFRRSVMRPAERAWHEFQAAREYNEAGDQPVPGGCGCGCNGMNGRFAWYTRNLRVAARVMRTAKTPEDRQKASESLESWKTGLLHALWQFGRRRIDRVRLRQHAIEGVRTECEMLADGPFYTGIPHAREMVASCRRRLRAGVYERGQCKGQRYSKAKRAAVEKELRQWRNAITERSAQLVELRAQLADETALVRNWTGCERTPRAAAGGA